MSILKMFHSKALLRSKLEEIKALFGEPFPLLKHNKGSLRRAFSLLNNLAYSCKRIESLRLFLQKMLIYMIIFLSNQQTSVLYITSLSV